MTITIVGGGNPSGPTFPVQRSVRLRSSASAYFARTPASTSNRTTWTWSGWIKRGALSGTYGIFGAGTDNGTNRTLFWFTSSDTLIYQEGSTNLRTTNAVFRDPSAWGHLVVVVDNGNATPANRILIYWNGVLQTTTGTGDPGSTQMNLSGVAMKIGTRTNPPTSEFFDGYLTEINFIDGQALTPTSFGAYNSYGVWSPAKYSGTYGTNGFYLNFQDNSAATATTIGKDSSGNGNNWTPNNISVTAGTTYDSMLDVPTLTSTTNSNFATWNPLDKATVTVSNANLSAVSGADVHAIRASMGLPLSGKFYWETTVSGLGYGSSLGIANAASNLTTGSASAETRTYQWGSWFNSFNSGVVQYGTNQAVTGGANWSGASQLAASDILMIAVDMDNGSMWVGKNGTWFNSSGTANPATNTDPRWTGLGGTTWFAYYSSYGATSPPTANINFGQRPFTYTPPTGFKSLNTYNLPAPTIANGAAYMAASLYTGTGAALSVANTVNSVSFQPDLVWLKGRSVAYNNYLYDSVRGALKELYSDSTSAEVTATQTMTSFNSGGFSVGTNAGINQSAATFVGWQWKANGTPAVVNTSGSIPSTISANPTAGFSIVTWTGNGSTGGVTLGHGLGVAPRMVVLKARTSAVDWLIYHASVGNTQGLFLNLTNAATTNSAYWNNTTPTSTVFTTTGNTGLSNQSGVNYVTYCFSEIPGFSKFGSYTGNGSADGPFVYTGFRPRWVMVKSSSIGGAGYSWFILDSSRNTYNVMGNYLLAQATDAEAVTNVIDFLSNGFKLRFGGGGVNPSGATMIYMAFAENPFNYSLAR